MKPGCGCSATLSPSSSQKWLEKTEKEALCLPPPLHITSALCSFARQPRSRRTSCVSDQRVSFPAVKPNAGRLIFRWLSVLGHWPSQWESGHKSKWTYKQHGRRRYALFTAPLLKRDGSSTIKRLVSPCVYYFLLFLCRCSSPVFTINGYNERLRLEK